MAQFANIYQGKTVLITGHTGFKGSWLALWLERLGARVVGYSLDVPSQPAHFDALKLKLIDRRGDVCDRERLSALIKETQPEIIFHLAAQSLVRAAYEQPLRTIASNVLGTATVLDCLREAPSVKALVNVTSDKCYENREWVWGYRESDAMGGFDPYSASKGCAELITASYRNSFFPTNGDQPSALIASARAGNVIGGGDWARDRLIPDLARGLRDGTTVVIRNPDSLRPWQHVLEPLSGYLLLGARLLSRDTNAAQAWNFGPNDDLSLSVGALAKIVQAELPHLKLDLQNVSNGPHEARLLRLDCSKARLFLNWFPIWDAATAASKAAKWYRAFLDGQLLSSNDLDDYLADAAKRSACWL